MDVMNKLLVIPSIDIKNGKTVRVVQGIPEMHTTAYGDDPIEMALIWRAENAKMLHVVDFDASQKKSKQNLELIEEMCDSVIIPIEYGGGIRSFDDAKEIFSLGVYRIVIGSLYFDNKNDFLKIIESYGPERVSAAIDVVDFEVVTHARQTKTGVLPQEHAENLVKLGVERFIVTDILRNGMMGEPNIELSELIAVETGKKVTHSGGVSSYKDLIELQNYVDEGIDSAIVGRALYENKFSCQKIWRLAESNIFTD
jgi:phosphoribosylformimino-5-aminoimidazole carboxamide ribotide isomerase